MIVGSAGVPVKLTPVMLGGGLPGTWKAPMPCGEPTPVGPS